MPEKQRKTYTFAEHDKLDRARFADFLLHLIENRDDYRRDPDETGAYSIAIDGAYGSGKTRFLQMFQSHLKDKNPSCSILYYNAWEHDIFQDALSSFIYQISNDDMFVDVQEDQEHQSRKEKLHKAAKIALNAIFAVGAKKLFGEDGKEVVDQIRDALAGDIVADRIVAPYDARRESLIALTEALACYATEENPLLVIVDELDRCAPDFAIQTLEIAKHLLNVSNTVFLFALDMRQARASIKKFYGQGIDADGYLCKIFDYVTILPEPSGEAYCSVRIKEPSSFFSKIPHHILKRILFLIQSKPSMSLRDIDYFLQSFQILWSSSLAEYKNIYAHLLYLDCLFLKLFRRKIYEALILGKSGSYLTESILPDLPDESKWFHELILHRDDLIGNGDIVLYKNDIEIELPFHYDQSFNDRAFIHRLTIDFIQSAEYCKIAPEGEISINLLLFEPDCRRFDKICRYTYGQYIHRQLEMFNFTLPTKPEAT